LCRSSINLEDAVLPATTREFAAMRNLQRSITLLAAFACASTAAANGYWNIPSTFCQCVGYGWGAGYHAPLVLGPITCRECLDHKEIRLPYSPAPSCGYCQSVGPCCECGLPSRLEGSITPYQSSPYQPAQHHYEEPTAEHVEASQQVGMPEQIEMPEVPPHHRPIFEAPIEP
jgi:hypothetical protein